MATTNIKRIMANSLAAYLSDNIAGLAGKVTAVAAGPETALPCLAVKILAEGFRFEPTNADELYWDEDNDDGKVVVDVGQFTGNLTLQLYTTSPAERELYEQAILDLFLATPWAPGTLYIDTPALTVNNYVSLHEAEIKYRLEDEEWREEMAFESKRYCFIDIYVDYPALTTYDAATIDSLQIWLSDEELEE